MNRLPFLSAFAFCCTFSLLLPRAAYSQDFSSLDRDLSALESLIQVDDLRKNLAESGTLIGSYRHTLITRQFHLRKAPYT
jgi:hypothetical protein